MIWKRKELVTVGDIIEAVEAIRSRKDAHKFMKLFRIETPHADDNIGYISGYCKNPKRILDWFQVSHPIFGKTLPTAREAFLAGMVWGALGKEKARLAFPPD